MKRIRTCKYCKKYYKHETEGSEELVCPKCQDSINKSNEKWETKP